MQGLLPALPVRPAKKLCWTGKATDLVELLYALDTCNCINNGEIGVEELADLRSGDKEQLQRLYEHETSQR